MSWIPVFQPLVDKDRHDRKPIVGLKENLFRNQEPSRTMEKGSRIVDRSTEVARRPGSVLDGEHVIAAVPFQPLMFHSEGVTICSWNGYARRRLSTFRGSEIEPSS